jgi:hypothetical protein
MAAVVGALCASVPLPAQYWAPTTLAHPASISPVSSSRAFGSTVAPERGHVSHDVLVGAAIGAGAGIVGAAIAASAPGVTDHSEDGILYVVSAALGAGLGMLVGLIVGLSRD